MSGGVAGSRGETAVHRLLEDLARLEGEDAAAGDHDLLARLRVATLARALLVDDEVAEAGDLHLLASLETLLQELEDRLHHIGRLLLREADLLVDALDDICLRHRHVRRLLRFSARGGNDGPAGPAPQR